MIDLIASFFLLFTREYIQVPIIVIGMLIGSRERYERCLLLLLATMIINPALKSWFEVPLRPELGPGYAFPSGHMQVAWVFWAWLAWEFRSRFFFVIVSIFAVGVGWALTHFNYHNAWDVLAAVGFGTLSLWVFNGLYRLSIFKYHATLKLSLFFLILFAPVTLIASWPKAYLLGIPLGSFVGLFLGSLCYALLLGNRSFIRFSLLRALVGLVGVVAIYMSLSFLLSAQFSAFWGFTIRYSLIIYWVSFLVWWAEKKLYLSR